MFIDDYFMHHWSSKELLLINNDFQCIRFLIKYLFGASSGSSLYYKVFE